MTDFPESQTPLFVSTMTRWSCTASLCRMANISPASITWTANQATYMPVTIPWPYRVARVFWANGSVNTTTNVDFGIYTAGGRRLYSTGSTAQGTVSQLQYVTPATPFTLPAGRYYFAWVCSGTTNRAFGTLPTVALAKMAGMLTQTSALPLPASATFATFTAVGLALCGITRTAVGTVY